MLFENDRGLQFGDRRSKSLVLSVVFHAVLALILVSSPGMFSTDRDRVIHVSGHEYERDYELTELVLPPELVEGQPPPEAEAVPAPEIAGVNPVLPLPEPEAAPPPPPPEPPSPPPPEPEDAPIPPPPIIGPDDVIEEGARPDAGPEAAENSPEVALDEVGESPEVPGSDGRPGPEGDGEDVVETPAESIEDTTTTQPPPEEEPPLLVGENRNPDGLTLPDLRRRANAIVEENLAENRREIVTGGRSGPSGSSDAIPDFSTEQPTILSDTRGYDFGPYMNQVVNRVRTNWYSLIPEGARLRQLRGRVVIIFTITKTGTVVNERIVANSGSEPLDRAALASILASNPFPRIPDDFEGENLVLQFTFLYNIS